MFIIAWPFKVPRRFLLTKTRMPGYRRARARSPVKDRRKPAWVVNEIIRLKALMPDAGCRHIAYNFNRRFADRRNASVGKTFVSEAIKAHLAEIHRCRQRLKHHRPKAIPINRIGASS